MKEPMSLDGPRTGLAPDGRAIWGPCDLVRRVGVAIAMAERAVQSAARDDGARDDGSPLVLAKVVAELAILLRCASAIRQVDGALHQDVERAAVRLAPYARSEAVATAICRTPAFAVDHATAHILLTDLGHPDEEFDRLLVEVLGGADVGGPERLPNHELERRWLLGIRADAGVAV